MPHLKSASKDGTLVILIRGLIFLCVLLFWEKGAEWLNNAKLPTPRILWEEVLLREYQEFDETDGMTL